MSSEAIQDRKFDEKGDGILLKALALRSIEVTPLAQKSVDELKSSVEQLYEFATSIGGDIARLGDERVVITPPGVRIWRGLQ